MLDDKNRGGMIQNVVSIGVAIVNAILGSVSEYIVKNVGFKSYSQKHRTVMFSTFVTSFINTAIIPIITLADLRFAPWPLSLLGPIIDYDYTDMSDKWWLVIGPQIVSNVSV
jgi:hypothetical protein